MPPPLTNRRVVTRIGGRGEVRRLSSAALSELAANATASASASASASSQSSLRGRRAVAYQTYVRQGANSMLALRVILTGTGGAPTCGEACLRDGMFGNGAGARSVAGLFLDSSGGFTFNNEAAASRASRVMTVSIDYPVNTCDADAIGNLADAAATAAGVDINQYTFKFYLIPSASACGWGGLAYVGACGEEAGSTYCKAWAKTQTSGSSTWTHELGHNVGMNHASTDTNNDGTIDDEYGDTTCPMGDSWQYQRFHALHRLEMSWLKPEKNVVTNAVGAVALKANGAVQAGSNDKALIRVGSRAANGDAYWVSLRTGSSTRPGSYDVGLDASVANKVHVHRFPLVMCNGLTGANSLLVATLSVGQSFNVPGDNVAVTFTSLSTATDTAVVTVGAFPLVLDAVTPCSSWRYNDRGTNLGTAWRAFGFDDAAWAVGAAEFGYGEGDETTVVSFGPDPNLKYFTTYFRQKFNVPDASKIRGARLVMAAQDGAVVYINGVEVVRDNMPTGAIAFNTPAVDTRWDAAAVTFVIPYGAVVTGDNNIIAVEVHRKRQYNPELSFSAVLSFDVTDLPVGPSPSPSPTAAASSSPSSTAAASSSPSSTAAASSSPSSTPAASTSSSGTPSASATFTGTQSASASPSPSPSRSRSRPVTATAFGANGFGSATVVSLSGFGSVALAGDTSRATRQAGEPVMMANSGESASVWGRWTAPSAGVLRLNMLGSSFDTLLAVYTGSSLTALTVRAFNDDCNTSGLHSCVTLAVTAGTRYNIKVDGFGGEKGLFTMSFAFSAT
jgi:hypothetical protein